MRQFIKLLVVFLLTTPLLVIAQESKAESVDTLQVLSFIWIAICCAMVLIM